MRVTKGLWQHVRTHLERLQTDYLDCYLLHSRSAFPLSETIKAFEQLVDEKKIRSLGLSNFDVEHINAAQQCLQRYSIACNQISYNLYNREMERSILPYCTQQNIAIIGYTPFGVDLEKSQNDKSAQVIHAIAQKHHATFRQIILAFLIRDKNVFTIPKSSKISHTIENAAAGDIVLDKEDLEKIDNAFPLGLV